VAELADALDSKTSVSLLLKPTHRYSTLHAVYQRSEGAHPQTCASLLTLAHRWVTDKWKSGARARETASAITGRSKASHG